jgi:imidazole glycerol-phosphate synthase subunit HisF
VSVPRVIPCLLTDGRALVKTRRFADPAYVGDPANVLSIFSEFEVDEIVVLDIAATREGRGPDFKLISRIVDESIVPLAYGGGITRLDEIDRIIDIGVEKVVLNSGWAADPSLVSRAAARHGSQAVLVSIDAVRTAGGARVATHCGSRVRHETPADRAVHAADAGAGELLVTSIDREGTREGYDLELIRSVSAAVTVPVIANGGAGSRRDLVRAVRDGGATAAAAGSIFVFYGALGAVLINFPTRTQVRGLFAASAPAA